MSISKMDWSGRNLNGALAHPNSQQYLPVTTSSTVLNMPNHTAYVPQNSYSLAQTFLPSNQNPILIGLLGADSSEEVHQIERAVLSKPEQQTTRVSPGQYNTIYNLLHKKSTATDLNNSSNIQTVVVSNSQTQVYPNFVLHALQQGKQLPVVQQQAQQLPVVQQQAQQLPVVQQQAQQLPVVQQQAQQLPVVQQQAQQLPVVQQQAQVVECYGANGYKTKIPQSAGYTQRKTHQRMSDSYAAKRPSQRVQVSYWPTMPQPNSVNINSAQNGSSAPNVSSYKSLNINIVPVSTANYQNGQNIHNQMGSNYQAISHTSALQPQQGMNDYVQSPQRQTTSNLHSGFSNNSSNVLPSATVGQAPPLYTQSNTSSSNVYNNSVNHNLSNQSQNFVAQNVQQPMQSYTLPQDQLSVAVPPPAYSENVQQVRRQHLQDILVLLKEYRDVKLKYLLLNRANNHLRQKMQSTSQDIPGSCPVRPPLISSILNTTVPADDSMGGQKVSQISTVQSRPPSNTTHIVQTPTLYDSLNVSVQNVAQPSNSPSSHAYPTNKSNVLNQTNYSSFESGQMNLGSGANSTGQVVNSDTLRVQDPRANVMVSMQINNQYHSSNSSNRNLSQDELHLTSVQTNTVASESCNPVHTTNTGNFYANTPLTSSSREAIKATLPLWKSVPQSSAQNKRGYSEPKHGLNTQPVSAEIASRSINEPTAITLTQKSEHSGPNVAIVSPLVKIKDMFKEINQHPKVPQGKDFANDDGVKENDCFNKSLLLLETVDAAASMKNLDVNPPISNMVSSPLCHVSSKCNVQKSAENVETVDENLQISGICTLVEGSSFYDSSVAMMFEGSLQTQLCSPLAKRDLEDHPNLQGSQDDIQTSGAFQATSSVSPATEMVAVKTDSEGDVEPCAKIQDNQQGADVCHEIQSEQTLSASDAFDLSSNNAADQLSDLLTEFPFGIKNYMSKNNLKSTGVSLEKFSKTEIPKTLVPFSYDSDGSIEDTQREDAMDTSTKETESPRIEITDQQSTLEQPRDEVLSVQFDEDGFEISDSPGDNMQITLLNQDEITKIFPEDSAEPIVDSKESVLERLLKEPTAPLADVSVRSIKENSNDETASTSDKVLFCCLFSWLTHTNGNAPKCNCKFTEYCETEDLTSNFSQPTAVSKTEPLTAFLDPSAGVHNSTRDLKPSPDPCNTELDEMLPPAIKRPKRKPVDISSESKSDPRIVNCSPQEEIKPKPDLSFKYFKDKLQKELRKNDTLTNEKILQSKSHMEDPNSKKTTKEPFSGYKSNVDSSRKLDKLIIKTDFLKNKHLLKMKKKYKERKTSHFEEGAAQSVEKSNKNAEVGESVKILNMDRVNGSKANNEKCKPPAATEQQLERAMNRLKSSSSLDKSHSRTQDRSPGKRRGRVKSQPESHFEKVKKVPTVQEYLERKRELCNQRSVPTVDKSDDATEGRHTVVERDSMERSGNLLPKLLPLTAAKMNVKTKNIAPEAIKHTRKGRPRVNGEYESLDKKYRGSTSGHGKGWLVSKGLDQKSTFHKEKIYLSPCDSSRRSSCDGISLTKLQIRCSPEKPGYYERRKSLDSSVHSKLSKSETKNEDAPKMLEFKLCPEFVHRSPSKQEKNGEPKAAKEKTVIEGIKSKKEAWCTGGPIKKSRMDSISEDQGCRSPSLSTSSFKSTQINSPRPLQDSQTTFNVFKQMYHEQRSKSLDASL